MIRLDYLTIFIHLFLLLVQLTALSFLLRSMSVGESAVGTDFCPLVAQAPCDPQKAACLEIMDFLSWKNTIILWLFKATEQ